MKYRRSMMAYELAYASLKFRNSEIVATINDSSNTPQIQIIIPRDHPPYVLGNTSPYPTVVIVTTIFQIAVGNLS